MNTIIREIIKDIYYNYYLPETQRENEPEVYDLDDFFNQVSPTLNETFQDDMENFYLRLCGENLELLPKHWENA